MYLQFTCRRVESCEQNSTLVSQQYAWSDHRACPVPLYISLSCCLSLLGVAVFLRLPILIKGALLAAMTTGYLVLMQGTHNHLFECYDRIVGLVLERVHFYILYPILTQSMPILLCQLNKVCLIISHFNLIASVPLVYRDSIPTRRLYSKDCNYPFENLSNGPPVSVQSQGLFSDTTMSQFHSNEN